MGKSCVARWCRSQYTPGQSGIKSVTGISWHCFPYKNPALLKEWLDFVGRDMNNIPSAYCKLCSAHFTDDCFTDSSGVSRMDKKTGKPRVIRERARLRADAVPTLTGVETKSSRRSHFRDYPTETERVKNRCHNLKKVKYIL